MRISGDNNLSLLKSCLDAAYRFLLSDEEAKTIFAHIENVIREHWDTVCEEAGLNDIDKKLLWKRQFLNPFSFEE
jgi:serine/threonine-protein kinase HipA